MVSKIFSAALDGLSAKLIEVEASAVKGLRSFNIVGLADKAIEEAKERINVALKNANFSPPIAQRKRILINLAPADLKKEGSIYDLPIALAYLVSTDQLPAISNKIIAFGELSLDGRLKPIKGTLPLSLLAKNENFSEIIIPRENGKESALANLLPDKKKIKIIAASTIDEVIKHILGIKNIEPTSISPDDIKENREFEIDFSWIKGQEHAKRGLEIAAAGGHNILFEGPPGTGKTLIAKSVLSIMPKLNEEEIIELTKIYSVAGLLGKGNDFITERPFRAPHHSASVSAIVGGGNPPRAGEITLAHRGILFLDEFPEFHRDVLESLRVPIEEGRVTIQRARYSLSLPAKFSLIAAANPCPCGYYGDPERECTCTISQVTAYRRKLKGPLIDRIDLFSWVSSLKYEHLSSTSDNKTEEIREKIEIAREIQKERFEESGILTNSEMILPMIKKYCQTGSHSQEILKKFVNKGMLTARGYYRVLKVARTIADLERRENISNDDIMEALSYRKKD